MDQIEAKKQSLRLMEEADDVIFSTIGEDGYPQTRVMFNLRCKSKFPEFTGFFAAQKKEFLYYLATNTSSSKINELKKNSKATVFFANSADFHSLMLTGNVEMVDDPAIKQSLWKDGWEMYYPKGVNDPDFSVIVFEPVYGKGWYHDSAFNFKL